MSNEQFTSNTAWYLPDGVEETLVWRDSNGNLGRKIDGKFVPYTHEVVWCGDL